MSNERPKTYPVTRADGSIVRVTVPENDEGDLFEAIREQMCPEAIAAIAAALKPVTVTYRDVDRQVRWFADGLVDLLGGQEQHARLVNELGL